ncbi:MAG TPA: DUF1570 domain-containing protein [Terriglobales bacterium]|nr:DUF1570 domain-containing protein [Terriglobales bacterium]
MFLSFAPLAWAAPHWVELRSPHFVVLCDGGDSAARHVAGQLESMREVFHESFPGLALEETTPIQVVVVNDHKEFVQLEPAGYLGRGKLDLAGYFERSPEASFILLRLDAQDSENPYRVIYHEYTHSLTMKSDDVMPVWLHEGLAEFYETTKISGDDVSLGVPDPYQINLLRGQPMMPLATLFAVDHTSPYYHEEDKASIFYAESWALTHYLMMSDRGKPQPRLAVYLSRLQAKEDPVRAAQEAFGDLNQLQKDLLQYIRRQSFSYINVKLRIAVREKTYPIAAVTAGQADVVRANLLAHVQRLDDAEKILQPILQAGPPSAAAAEAMGYISYRRDDTAAALHWYGQAVALDSTNFLAQYFYAAMQMGDHDPSSLDAATVAKLQASLRTAIKLNPGFAPAYDRLAILDSARPEDAAEADRLELQAIQLEPANFTYRLNRAYLLLRAQRPDDAIAAIAAARPLATSPDEVAACDRDLQSANSMKEYAAAKAAYEQAKAATLAVPAAAAQDAAPPPAAPETSDVPPGSSTLPGPPLRIHRVATASQPPDIAGVRQTIEGTIGTVACGLTHDKGQAANQVRFTLRMQIQTGSRIVTLQSDDYLKVPFKATNFTPTKTLNPCADLIGMAARVTAAGDQILTVELARQK